MGANDALDDLFDFEREEVEKENFSKAKTCKAKVVEKIRIIKGTVLDDLYILERKIFISQKRQSSRQTMPDFYMA